jgi:hypothetical protein
LFLWEFVPKSDFGGLPSSRLLATLAVTGVYQVKMVTMMMMMMMMMMMTTMMMMMMMRMMMTITMTMTTTIMTTAGNTVDCWTLRCSVAEAPRAGSRSQLPQACVSCVRQGVPSRLLSALPHASPLWQEAFPL